MIKGMTLVQRVPDADAARLRELFAALGFERGRGWEDGQGRGAAFLAPVAI